MTGLGLTRRGLVALLGAGAALAGTATALAADQEVRISGFAFAPETRERQPRREGDLALGADPTPTIP